MYSIKFEDIKCNHKYNARSEENSNTKSMAQLM